MGKPDVEAIRRILLDFWDNSVPALTRRDGAIKPAKHTALLIVGKTLRQDLSKLPAHR